VSLTAFKTVMAMDENPNLPELTFEISVPYGVARKNAEQTAKCADEADIDWLFAETLGVKRSQVPELKALTKEQYDRIMEYAKQMSDGTPLQYALGNTDFYGIKISVNKNVLIPRPETEELVMLTERRVAAFDRPRILDVCTGSGCIAVALGHRIPTAETTALDISREALEIARENGRRLGVEVEWIEDDALGGMARLAGRRFDVIVSNPPYIPRSEMASMHRNVTGYEPHEALFVDDSDPLAFYRAIARAAVGMLSDGGSLLFEVHERLAERTADVLRAEGFADVRIEKDCFGKQRMVCGSKNRR